jgi:hypothetical protein
MPKRVIHIGPRGGRYYNKVQAFVDPTKRKIGFKSKKVYLAKPTKKEKRSGGCYFGGIREAHKFDEKNQLEAKFLYVRFFGPKMMCIYIRLKDPVPARAMGFPVALKTKTCLWERAWIDMMNDAEKVYGIGVAIGTEENDPQAAGEKCVKALAPGSLIWISGLRS